MIQFLTIQTLELILQSKSVFEKFAYNDDFKIKGISIQDVVRSMANSDTFGDLDSRINFIINSCILQINKVEKSLDDQTSKMKRKHIRSLIKSALEKDYELILDQKDDGSRSEN